jgi:hypothetical protein
MLEPSKLFLGCGNTLRAMKAYPGAGECHLGALKTLTGAVNVLAGALEANPRARDVLTGAEGAHPGAGEALLGLLKLTQSHKGLSRSRTESS